MAEIGATNMTLLDHIKLLEPDGSVAEVVDLLTKRNSVLQDAVWKEGNLPNGHMTTIETGLPTLAWRKYNEGITASKGTTEQVTESTGMLEGLSKVDKKLANMNGNALAYRQTRDNQFLRAFKNDLSTALFYSSTKANPERIMGLTPRYDDYLTADNSENIVICDATAADDNSRSMWFCTWGDDTMYGIYPKGSKVGLENTDLGIQLTKDRGGTKEFLAYVTHWGWDLGLVVKDWRYQVRIANIDPNVSVATSKTIISAMIKAYNLIRDYDSGTTVIYVGRTILSLLDQQITDKGQVLFNMIEWHGRPVLAFRGIPILPQEALDTDEVDIPVS